MNVDPELRKRVEQIKSSPVQLYREAGDYSNRELVEGIVVSPDDIAAIEAVARAGSGRQSWVDGFRVGFASFTPGHIPSRAELEREYDEVWADDPAEAAHHRMVQPDHYQRWER
jgi:hypothetical protein